MNALKDISILKTLNKHKLIALQSCIKRYTLINQMGDNKTTKIIICAYKPYRRI